MLSHLNLLSNAIKFTESGSIIVRMAKVGGAGTIEQLAPMLENRNPYVALSAANAIRRPIPFTGCSNSHED